MVALVLQVSDTMASHSIRYQDCTTPLRVNTFNAFEICNNPAESKTQPHYYKILMPRKTIKMKGYRCTVRKSTFMLYCGAFSHTKLMRTPEIEVLETVTKDQCLHMVNSGKFRVPSTGSLLHVAIGEEHVHAVNALGVVHAEGSVSCEGQQLKIQGTNIVNNVIDMEQFKITIAKENYIQSGDRVENVQDHVKFPASCGVGDRGCSTVMGTYTWDIPAERCQFEEARSDGKFYEDGEYLVDKDHKLRVKLGEDVMMSNHCPTGKIWYTDQTDIMLTKTAGYPRMPAADLDIFLYINSRQDYLQYHLEKSRGDLENDMKKTICNTQYNSEQNKIYQIGKLNALRRGDVVYTFTCKNETGIIASSDKCYNSIALTNGKFVDPITRISSKHATAIECNENFPLYVKTEGQGWVAVSSVIKPVAEPKIRHIEAASQEHESMEGMVYHKQQIKEWEVLVQQGTYRDAIVEKISRGLCRQDEECALEPHESFAQYTLNGISTEIIQELDWTERLYNYLEKNMFWIMLLLIIHAAIQYFISFSVVLQIICIGGKKAGASALYAVCCMLPYAVGRVKHNVEKSLPPRQPMGHNHAQEMQPLARAPPYPMEGGPGTALPPGHA